MKKNIFTKFVVKKTTKNRNKHEWNWINFRSVTFNMTAHTMIMWNSVCGFTVQFLVFVIQTLWFSKDNSYIMPWRHIFLKFVTLILAIMYPRTVYSKGLLNPISAMLSESGPGRWRFLRHHQVGDRAFASIFWQKIQNGGLESHFVSTWNFLYNEVQVNILAENLKWRPGTPFCLSFLETTWNFLYNEGQVNILTGNSKWRPGKPFCLSF